MEYSSIIQTIAGLLKQFDGESPVHKEFQPGIGPFGEPQIVRIIADRLCKFGLSALTKRTPDLAIGRE